MKIFKAKYIPLTIIIGFNFFTLFIFFTAPILWKTNNMFLFFLFALICQGLIALGYKIGYDKYSARDVSKKPLFTLSNERLNFIFIFYAATFLIKYAYLLRYAIFDIRGMVSVLLIGLAAPTNGYALTLDSTIPYTVSWTLYFIISIINNSFFIIGFIKWRDMNRAKKYAFLFFVFIEIFYWMGRGTNFGVISIITTLLFSMMYKLKSIKLSFRQIVLYGSLTIVLLIGSIAVFSFNMNSRRGGAELSYDQFDFGKSYVDENSAAFAVVPVALHDTYMYVVSYLSQGYYHTCLAFDLSFQSTYFLGGNPALIALASIAHIDVWENTYVYRLKDKGVDPLVNWHSAYTWYANDVSFFGVPVVLFIIGYLLGISWTFSLNQNDFLSKIVFIVLGNMLLYLFANNTYLSSVFYSFVFICPLWYLTRVNRIKFS